MKGTLGRNSFADTAKFGSYLECFQHMIEEAKGRLDELNHSKY